METQKAWEITPRLASEPSPRLPMRKGPGRLPPPPAAGCALALLPAPPCTGVAPTLPAGLPAAPRRHSGAPVSLEKRWAPAGASRWGERLACPEAEPSATGPARPDPAPPRPTFPPSGGSRAIRPEAGRERQLKARTLHRAPFSREAGERPGPGPCAWGATVGTCLGSAPRLPRTRTWRRVSLAGGVTPSPPGSLNYGSRESARAERGGTPVASGKPPPVGRAWRWRRAAKAAVLADASLPVSGQGSWNRLTRSIWIGVFRPLCDYLQDSGGLPAPKSRADDLRTTREEQELLLDICLMKIKPFMP